MIDLPSLKGLVKGLLFTHNTMVPVLWMILSSSWNSCIRGVDTKGHAINKGAQFRDGLDSQYGEIIFVMKPNFWLNMSGCDFHKKEITQQPMFGHFYKRDFIEHSQESNQVLIERWLDKDARFYDFRPPTSGLNGQECRHREWNVSWCNIQLHIGQNISFDWVEKVYAPAWVLYDNITLNQIEMAGLNMSVLQRAVSNKYPFYSDGQPNLLNGKFHLYGPPRANHHYHLIEPKTSRMNLISRQIYSYIQPDSGSFTVQTHRHSGSSSAISLHEDAFRDVEMKYVLDLVRHNLTDATDEQIHQISKQLLFPYS